MRHATMRLAIRNVSKSGAEIRVIQSAWNHCGAVTRDVIITGILLSDGYGFTKCECAVARY